MKTLQPREVNGFVIEQNVPIKERPKSTVVAFTQAVEQLQIGESLLVPKFFAYHSQVLRVIEYYTSNTYRTCHVDKLKARVHRVS